MRQYLVVTTFLAGAALLAGCGGAATLGAPGAQGAAATRVAASWMAPESKSQDLLYVSDNDGVVDVLAYPALKVVGQLTGFSGPAGLCSDSKGDVYITDTQSEHIYEYKHGGKTPIATINDFGFYPEGCSVDPTTGNLAVANYNGLQASAGSVAIYTNPSGPPTGYVDNDFFLYFFCSYDAKGNLYVDGVNNGTTASELGILKKGGSTLNTIVVDKTIVYPGAVQWDGKDVAIEDVSDDVLYRVKVSGLSGKVVGTTTFKGPRADELQQFWLQGKTLVMPYGTSTRQMHKIGLWAYPAGGSPTADLTVPGSVELLGVTVSAASK